MLGYVLVLLSSATHYIQSFTAITSTSQLYKSKTVFINQEAISGQSIWYIKL